MNYLATTNSVMGAEDEAFCLDLENLLRHSGQTGQSDESRAVLRACRRREDSMYRLRTSVRDNSNGESGKRIWCVVRGFDEVKNLYKGRLT